MACDAWIDAISALADGEEPGVAPQLLERHLRTCATCRAFQSGLQSMPDLSAPIARAVTVADRTSRWALIRLMLGLVAGQIVVLSVPALLFGDQPGSSPHGGRHLGAFSLAYAVGLIVVVARPARARTMLPVAQVLCAAIVLSTLVDVIDGSVGASGEVVHLPEVISVVLLWALAVPPTRRVGARSRLRFRRPQQQRTSQREAG
jgi:predicted anti-sigma-YlaC factor YlaD